MGYAKYNEDDYEFVCERLYSNAITYTKSKKESIRLLRCPYCEKSYKSKILLFSHIKSEHNISRPIVFVNGAVAKDCIYISDVKSVTIHLYGFDEKILIDGTVGAYLSDEYDIVDITKEVSDRFIDNGKCTLKIRDKIINIKRYSLNSINREMLSIYIEKWEDALKNGHSLSMSIIERKDLNQAEYFYIEGIFNYFVACQANGKDKNDRYNEANSILKNFVPLNSLGICIQKIVAFRLNWVNTLNYLCKQYETTDEFNKICDFFENKPSNNTKEFEKTKKLYMEDELQDIFDAIVSYQKKDYDSVNKYLDSHDESAISDVNLVDKILLLKFRMKVIEGNKAEANYYRREIICEEYKY